MGGEFKGWKSRGIELPHRGPALEAEPPNLKKRRFILRKRKRSLRGKTENGKASADKGISARLWLRRDPCQCVRRRFGESVNLQKGAREVKEFQVGQGPRWKGKFDGDPASRSGSSNGKGSSRGAEKKPTSKRGGNGLYKNEEKLSSDNTEGENHPTGEGARA